MTSRNSLLLGLERQCATEQGKSGSLGVAGRRGLLCFVLNKTRPHEPAGRMIPANQRTD